MKNLRICTSVLLYLLWGFWPGAGKLLAQEVSNQEARCDTIVFKLQGESYSYRAEIVSEDRIFFNLRLCESEVTESVDKRRVVSINGEPYTYTPYSLDHYQTMQDSGSYVVVIMHNKNVFMGNIAGQNKDTLFLQSADMGLLSLPKSSIKRIRPISEKQAASRVFLTSQGINTRYFFGTNGYPLEQGTGYYQNTWVLFNQFAVGVTDDFSVGGGLIPLFLFGGVPTPLWGTLKYSLPLGSESFHAAVGTLFGTIAGADAGAFGLIFGQATFGSRTSHVNLGLGYGFADGGFGERPTLTLSAITPMGKKAAFITENYLISAGNENAGILSAGARFYLQSVAIDGALAAPVGEDVGFFLLPWLGISIPFGE